MRKNVRMTWKETLQENVYVMSPMHEDNVSSIYYFEFVLGTYDQTVLVSKLSLLSNCLLAMAQCSDDSD